MKRPGPFARIWAVTALISLLAAALYLVEAREYGSGPGITVIAWLALASAFALAETLIVHLHFRGNAHSFSMLEVPLVVGLFLTTPFALVTAQVAGAAVALTLHRRQAPLKLAFNLASLALESTLAILVFRAVNATLAPGHPEGALAAFPAAMLASFLAIMLVFTAISLSQQRWVIGNLGRPLVFGLLVTVLTTSLGIAAVIMINFSPASLFFLVLPTSGVYLATHAYTRERQRHQSLEFLYQSARGLNRARQLEVALLDTLRTAREAFRTDVSEVYLMSANRDVMLRTAMGPGDVSVALQPSEISPAEIWHYFSDLPSAGAVMALQTGSRFTSFLERRGIRDALVAPLRGETKLIGFLVLADRGSSVDRYGRDDLKVAETLANQIAVALENAELERSLEQLETLRNELTYQAFHDPLTGLANRALFGKRVSNAFEQSRPSQPVAVLFVDLDDFKTVNDSLGHAKGDELLVEVGSRLNASVHERDLVARLGGDEFALLLEDSTSVVDPSLVADRVLGAFSLPVEIDRDSLPVHVSIGVATSEHSLNADQLLRNADVAMYAAKGRGKNQVALFEPSLLTAAIERYNLTTDLHSAAANGEFVAWFQPFVDLSTNAVVGVEALVRWNHPRRGLLRPDSFITLAAESDIIESIRRAIIEQSMAFLKRADQVMPMLPAIYAAINVTIRDMESEGMIPELICSLGDCGIEPSRLLFEVSEAAMFHDATIVRETLEKLRELGSRVALDDFGTGYSSLGQLTSLPVDMIKLAKIFVDDLEHSQSARAMAAAIVRLGHVLEKEVIAEGIETPGQREELSLIGCDLGQGYFLGYPMPQEQCIEWIRRWPTEGGSARTLGQRAA